MRVLISTQRNFLRTGSARFFAESVVAGPVFFESIEMNNEVKKQILLRPAEKLAKRLARDAKRQSTATKVVSQQAVITGILTDHYFCSDCGRPLADVGGGTCATCEVTR
jgi:NADH pyrophosphatase NudC (nudix superfamily)